MNTLSLPQPVAISPHRIHPQTRPGYVHLNVANLERQVTFYQQVIGLRLNRREGTSAGLGVEGQDLVRLTEIPNGRRYRGVTGIYHFAILFPNRRELARAVSRLFSLRWPSYPTDHVMTKTTYLDDPEGNNIELYCESPEDGVFVVNADGNFYARHADGRPSDGREPLDLDALFSHLTEDDRLDEPDSPEVRMGHFHLYVANLNETRRFYHDLLGFDDMGMARGFRMGMVSAGGYHHHIGFNTWQGEGAPPPPPDSLGLRYFTFNLPNQAELEHVVERVQQAGTATEQTKEGILVHDPSQNGVLLTEVSAYSPLPSLGSGTPTML
jgi:catechol 2,3-dioxygenase